MIHLCQPTSLKSTYRGWRRHLLRERRFSFAARPPFLFTLTPSLQLAPPLSRPHPGTVYPVFLALPQAWSLSRPLLLLLALSFVPFLPLILLPCLTKGSPRPSWLYVTKSGLSWAQLCSSCPTDLHTLRCPSLCFPASSSLAAEERLCSGSEVVLFSGLTSRRKPRLPVPARAFWRSSVFRLKASQKPLALWLWRPVLSNLVSSRVSSGSSWYSERYMFSLWAPGPKDALSLRSSRSSAESTLSSSGMEEILKEMCTLLWSSAMELSARGSKRKRKRCKGVQEFSVVYTCIDLTLNRTQTDPHFATSSLTMLPGKKPWRWLMLKFQLLPRRHKVH